jgi:hypothetical protein
VGAKGIEEERQEEAIFFIRYKYLRNFPLLDLLSTKLSLLFRPIFHILTDIPYPFSRPLAKKLL